MPKRKLPPKPPTKLAYTLQEAQARGCGCIATLYQQINAGKLKAKKLGGRTVILSEDLQEWLGARPFPAGNANRALTKKRLEKRAERQKRAHVVRAAT